MNSIKGGLQMDEFQFHFQPKVDVQNHQIIGYEILLRNKEQNPYYPAKRMEKIINSRAKHASFLEWFQSELVQLLCYFPTLQFSINFAPKQLFYLETHLFLTKMKPYAEQLIVEVTEDLPLFAASMENIDALTIEQNLQSMFASIKAKGYRIALDDVGSGKNSLDEVLKFTSYLDQIKFSIVKCSKKNLKEETLHLFLHAWQSFAEDYQLDFIVEGIEDQAVSNGLKNQGIFVQQGYHFGKPSKCIKR
ncbi:EAL domain-containing protein [Carnobacterium mobile]|uniref:EAL domain-containing protein n=1 Tax=Carnobacterium mobile TaxID=2750 RepID=UPI000A01A204|nr:EAL domain-containing protein [Carnobacterium mobile]